MRELLVLLLLLPGPAVAEEAPPAERRTELLYLLRQDCGSCHGMTLAGGLGPALLPEALSDRTVEGLAEVIRAGIPGTPMPPWGFEITGEEARWLARKLKEGIPP